MLSDFSYFSQHVESSAYAFTGFTGYYTDTINPREDTALTTC